MAKRFVDTNKYKKKFIRNLPSTYKIFWDYLCCNCDAAGIWHADFDVARLETGEKSLREPRALELFDHKVIVFDGGEKWFLPSFVHFQYGEIEETTTSKPLQSIIKQLRSHNLWKDYKEYLERKMKGYPKGIHTLKDSVQELDSELDKESSENKDVIGSKVAEKSFKKIPPTLVEIVITCFDRNYPEVETEAEKFYNYYESNGWRVGKNPVKDWGALLSNWFKNYKKFENGKSTSPDTKRERIERNVAAIEKVIRNVTGQ